jgi:hypothetical protein
MPASRPLNERFWEKVDKQGPTGPHLDTACWIWTASKDRHGYGTIGVSASRSRRAHRVSWTLEHGPIPLGLHVLHKCHNTSCVNPNHLYLGSSTQNARDRVLSKRVNAVKGEEHPNSILSDSDVKDILRLRSLDTPYKTIAKQYAVSVSTIHGICSGKRWSHLDGFSNHALSIQRGVRSGARHPSSKITPAMVAAMLNMRSYGCTYQQIADHFSLSKSGIHKALRRFNRPGT